MYATMAPVYDKLFPVSDAQVAFVTGRLGPCSRVLDVGCGTGQLAAALVERGHTVTGVDLDAAMIERARARGTSARFLVGNMTQLEDLVPAGVWDAVLCLGNSLVHLPDEHAIAQTLGSMTRLLRDGGQLMVQLLNYDRILDQAVRDLPPIDVDELCLQRWYTPAERGARVVFHTRVTSRGGALLHDGQTTLIPMRRGELLDHLAGAGSSAVTTYGGFDASAWHPDALPLVAVGFKEHDKVPMRQENHSR